jgi:phospholipid/cholesterol/gamma-HCH transport system permease protein
MLLGQMSLYSVSMVRFILQGQVSFKHYKQQAAFVGFDTLGIALVMTTFSGMVIALQIAREMVKQGAGDFVGALVAMALVRELGPVMTTFAVTAMACSAYAAELSTMNITSQTDALKTLHVDPVKYLLLPRVLAGVTMLPLMNILTVISGILGGLVVSTLLAGVPPWQYLDSVWQQVEARDIIIMLGKAVLNGYIIFMTSTTIGLSTHGGAKEVGIATTRAVVWSFILTAILDYLLTYLLYGTHA